MTILNICPCCGKPKRPANLDGLGTALKPAMELIALARKPLSEGTIAANVLRWGTGGLNIDAARIEHITVGTGNLAQNSHLRKSIKGGKHQKITSYSLPEKEGSCSPLGRWPANVCHDGSDEVVGTFPQSDGQRASVGPQHGPKHSINCYGDYGPRELTEPLGDSGSAARFFYSAKANASDRLFSKHPTVKPVDLMRWLVRMVTPPGGTVLDPFAGTGTTGHAALLEGFNAVLIEREAEYQADIARRMALVFAGEIERASHAEQESHESLPLFGADNAGGGKSKRLVYGKFARDAASGQSE